MLPAGGSAGAGGAIGGGVSGSGSMLGPTLANGRITGLPGVGNSNIELRLRPQPNGFLHGELVIHQPGFGLTPVEGFIRGDHLQFHIEQRFGRSGVTDRLYRLYPETGLIEETLIGVFALTSDGVGRQQALWPCGEMRL